MNLSSSFYFGIFFLLKASIALSAPHSSYPADEDEEALIDKLASLAAAVNPDVFLSPPKPPQNYDFAASYLTAGAGGPSLVSGGDFVGGGGAEDALVAREAALKLPREFGYKPNDLRFYLPADQFPSPIQDEETQQGQQQPSPQLLEEETTPPKQNVPPQQQQSLVPPPPPPPAQKEFEGQHEFVMGDDKSDFYFMKKKEQMRGSGGGGNGDGGGDAVRNFVPGPSHFMASEHSANYPGFSSNQINQDKAFSYSDMYYIAIVAGCSAAAVVGLIAAGICWYRIHERIKAAADVDYPAYGVTGPSKDITPSGGGDRKLAQSAQMYHYQHQKQQMAALQKGAIQGDRQGSGGSDVESDDDNEDGDYTVYECPGLAPAGEMEVKNPLFNDEQPTPSNGSSNNNKHQQQEPPEQQQQLQQASSISQDSSSSPAADSASSSASSTATVTSSTPKVTESPKTPTPAPTSEKSSKPDKEKGKGERK